MPVVVLDIEGTVSPTASVHDQLFGYTAARVADWLRDARHDDLTAETLTAVAKEAGLPTVDEAEAARLVRHWIDTGVKSVALKTVQGHICHEGFLAGHLRGRFYPDVRPALERWLAAGTPVFIYSSGSARNQRDWLHHAEGGPLTDAVAGYFDLVTAGQKTRPESYRRIADAIGVTAADIVFLSDHPAELAAAAAAGWSPVGVSRPGEPHTPVPPHRWIRSLDELEPLSPARQTNAAGRGDRWSGPSDPDHR